MNYLLALFVCLSGVAAMPSPKHGDARAGARMLTRQGRQDRLAPNPYDRARRVQSAPVAAMLTGVNTVAVDDSGRSGVGPLPALRLSWLFPPSAQTADLVFKIYSSSTLRRPITNWSVFAIVAGTNRALVFSPTNPEAFFTVTASNGLGESFPATK